MHLLPPPHESCLSSGAAMGSKYISFKLEKICSHSYSGARKEFCIEMCLKHSYMTEDICLCIRENAFQIADPWVIWAACVARAWKWLGIIKVTASSERRDGCIVSFIKYVIKFFTRKEEKWLCSSVVVPRFALFEFLGCFFFVFFFYSGKQRHRCLLYCMLNK